MEQSWEADPAKRITAAEIVMRLKEMQLPKSSKDKGAKPNKYRNAQYAERNGKKCSIS
jgi:hypothetical protein